MLSGQMRQAIVTMLKSMLITPPRGKSLYIKRIPASFRHISAIIYLPSNDNADTTPLISNGLPRLSGQKDYFRPWAALPDRFAYYASYVLMPDDYFIAKRWCWYA